MNNSLFQQDTLTQSAPSTVAASSYTITITGGTCKDGKPESVSRLDITAGKSLAVVGPTGSGKSELLSDIEQQAWGDTLSSRKIRFQNSAAPALVGNQSGMVAQLTQKTGFVMDCSVADFLTLHARCRTKKTNAIVDTVLAAANRLCGEPIAPEAGLQILSGGQARALMIADIAHISDAPVVLIDEIENAGIDKLAAMQLLSASSKVIIISTHDPVLILMAARRVVMKNGGMEQIKSTSGDEKNCLRQLHEIDALMTKARHLLRTGHALTKEVLHP